MEKRSALMKQICPAFLLITERVECACNLMLVPHLLTRQNSKELKLSSYDTQLNYTLLCHTKKGAKVGNRLGLEIKRVTVLL